MKNRSQNSNSIQRFARLDLLRAFAVTIVVCFHLKIPGFELGYLGVDIFFIISGFLMTHTMLLDKKKFGVFRIQQFFVRRIRRIIPSLFITLLFTGIAAYMLFSPEQLLDTAKQGLSAQIFASNILFLNQAGYFAPTDNVRVLLHTWSLSVEEQFYLLFALMLFLAKKINFSAILLAVGAIGFVLLLLAYWALFFPSASIPFFSNIDNLNSAIFFLIPFRVVQFASGGIIASQLYTRKRVFGKRFQFIGIAAPILGILVLQYSSLAQTISTLIIIVCFSFIFIENPTAERLGQLAPVKFISKISYQIYLLHWPLIVFWSYWNFKELDIWQVLVLLALSLTGGWLLFKFNELILNSSISRTFKTSLLIVIAGVSIVIYSHAFISEGAEWRLRPDRRSISPQAWRELENDYCSGTHKIEDVELGGKASQPLVTCSREVRGNKTIYSLGDSHARHLIPGLSEAFPDHTISAMYFTSCIAQSGLENFYSAYEGRINLAQACADRNLRAIEFFRNEPPTSILIHQYAGYEGDESEAWFEAADYLLEKLISFGHEVKWIGAVIRPDILVADCLAVPDVYPDEFLEKRCVGDAKIAQLVFQKNQILHDIYPEKYINLNEFFCPTGQPENCKVARNGQPLFRDKHHLTTDASILLIETIKLDLDIQDSHP